MPVLGDDLDAVEDKYVKKDDIAIFELTNIFNLLLDEEPMELEYSGTRMGCVEFIQDDPMLKAGVTFDGEDDVFDGEFSGITAWLEDELSYVKDG